MIDWKTTSPAIAIFALAACGGGSEDASSIAEKYAFQAQVVAGVNRMPGPPRLPTDDCPKVFVAFSVRATKADLPANMYAQRFAFSKAGATVWAADVTKSDSGIGERWATADDWVSNFGLVDGKPAAGMQLVRVLQGEVRGCETANLPIEQELDAEIQIVVDEVPIVLRTTASIGAAH